MLEWRDVWVKGSFFLPFRTRGRHNKSGFRTCFSVKDGVKPEKRGFQPIRKKLGEKFGVVFSLTVVVTDTELFVTYTVLDHLVLYRLSQMYVRPLETDTQT